MKHIIGVLFLLTLLESCHSSAILQTAKPVSKGSTEVSVAASGYSVSDIIPGVNAMVRTGINERSDIGFAYSGTLYFQIRSDYKHVLWSHPQQSAFFSSGVGLDVLLLNDWGSDINSNIGLIAPLYFSFNHDGRVTPYFAQSFTMGLFGLRTLADYRSSGPFHSSYREHVMFYSGGAGIRFGQRKRIRWMVELSYKVWGTHRLYVGDEDIFRHYDRDGQVELSVGAIIKSKN